MSEYLNLRAEQLLTQADSLIEQRDLLKIDVENLQAKLKVFEDNYNDAYGGDLCLLDNDKLKERILLMHSWVKHHQKSIELKFKEKAEIQAKLNLAKEALEDFKEHGTRHDINPTGQFKECGCFDSIDGTNWQRYIRSMNQYVVEKAREALKELGEV